MFRISVITSLYRCEQYLTYYFDGIDAIENFDECEFLLIHNDPLPEEEAIITQRIAGKKNIRHIKVPRETLYASWNRGIVEATAPLLANWNVDDRRTPDSLKLMAETLDNHPEVAMTYGDTVGIRKIGQTSGKKQVQRSYTEQNRKLFLHSHFIGCFQMWRKNIHEKVGYYDEQFKLAGDYEFQIRVTSFYPLKKTSGIMGYFLTGGGNARLSKQHRTQQMEQACISMRYGIYFKIHILSMLPALRQYQIFKGEFFQSSVDLSKIFGSNFKRRSLLKIYQIPWATTTMLPWEIARWVKVEILKIPTKA